MRAGRGIKPESPTPNVFFIDRCLGRYHLPTRLRDAGLQVEVHDEHFRPDAPDDEWLPVVGERGWYVLTRDDHIRFRKLETEAARNAAVGLFVIVSKNLTGPQTADLFVEAMPRIQRFIRKHRRPFVAKLYRDGSLQELKLTP